MYRGGPHPVRAHRRRKLTTACGSHNAGRVDTRVIHSLNAVSSSLKNCGVLDLACTRFSGRTAPPHPGGAPNCGNWVMVEGYSHELASCGFWPGGSSEGTFYAYAYPERGGYADHPVRPEAATYSTDINEFLLPYKDVRTSENPESTLLEFLQSTYEAAADNAA